MRLEAYLDSVGVPTICWGETEGARLGMKKTLAEYDAVLERRVLNHYYLPLVDKWRNFLNAPDSVQASMISGASNFGVGSVKPRSGQLGSTAMFIQIPAGNCARPAKRRRPGTRPGAGCCAGWCFAAK